jgi:hypothetical protein
MDVVDGDIPYYIKLKTIDLLYLGTYDNQAGRMDILQQINKVIPITVYGQNHEEWKKQGFTAYPAVFGKEANEIIAKAKIVLGTSCDPHLFGYWSNRVGRVLYAGGRLLQQYTPGMEQYLSEHVEYYSTSQEAIQKIQKQLAGEEWELSLIGETCVNRMKYTSGEKVKQLMIMIERYLKEDNGKGWLLP